MCKRNLDSPGGSLPCAVKPLDVCFYGAGGNRANVGGIELARVKLIAFALIYACYGVLWSTLGWVGVGCFVVIVFKNIKVVAQMCRCPNSLGALGHRFDEAVCLGGHGSMFVGSVAAVSFESVAVS